MFGGVNVQTYIKSLTVYYLLKCLDCLSTSVHNADDVRAVMMLSKTINEIVDNTDDIIFIQDSESCNDPPNKSKNHI